MNRDQILALAAKLERGSHGGKQMAKLSLAESVWIRQQLRAQLAPPAPAPAGHEICSACDRVFKFGETCTRGGCPCGGDL